MEFYALASSDEIATNVNDVRVVPNLLNYSDVRLIAEPADTVNRASDSHTAAHWLTYDAYTLQDSVPRYKICH
jgi:hypothetical protein